MCNHPTNSSALLLVRWRTSHVAVTSLSRCRIENNHVVRIPPPAMRSPPILFRGFLFALLTRPTDALIRECYPNATGSKTADGCYEHLRDIAIAMEEKDPFQFETFTLCPHKEYKIGNRDRSQPACFQDGDAMLELRQFSTVQCGASGSSNNNCTITGGFNQMATTAGSYSVEPKTRIEVAGITFAQGVGGALFLAAGGDIVFRDCVFKVRQQQPRTMRESNVKHTGSQQRWYNQNRVSIVRGRRRRTSWITTRGYKLCGCYL